MHNTVEIDDGYDAKTRGYAMPNFTLIDDGKISKIQQFDLSYTYLNLSPIFNILPPNVMTNAIKRNVISINKLITFLDFN